jgi:succinyl-diaminopimelate desuccinylase
MTESKEIIELTKKLMRFKTTSDRQNELERCMDFIEGYFSDHDVHVERFEKAGKPSLIISLGKTRKPELFLVGHIDVVPAADKLFTPKQKGSRLYGRGSYDDKSSVALMMVLVKQLSLLEEMPDIAIMITSDEETSGKAGSKFLLTKYTSEFAIVLDGGGQFEIVTKEKGALHLRLSAKGRNAHGSTPWEGNNSLDRLIDFYGNLKKRFPRPPKSGKQWVNTLNLGTLKGGNVPNQVPDYAEMGLDMRFVSDREKDRILGYVRKAKGIQVEVLTDARLLTTPERSRHVAGLQKAATKILGSKARFGREAGASDARYFADKGKHSVLLWPLGHHAHAEKEYVDIRSLSKLYRLLQLFILKNIRKTA